MPRARGERRTKPRQAGSPRALDRWQRDVIWCITTLRFQQHDGIVVERLTRLLASMRKAERR